MKRALVIVARVAVLLCVSMSGACSVIIKDPFAAFGNVMAQRGDSLPREAALEDLEFMVRLVERVHPDPYRIHPREAVETERRRVAETMPASLTTSDLCFRLSRVLAVLDDGHTGMSCDNLLRSEWERASRAAPPQTQRVLRFPPFIRLDDQQHLTFFEYRIIEPDIAYMNFFSIFDGLATVSRFEKAVDQMFKLVATDRPRVLIIDIRENGGGEDSVAQALLRHITEKRFRLLTSVQLKRSKEARDFVTSMIRIPFRWMGLHYLSSEVRQYFNGQVGTLSPPLERPLPERPRAEPFFDGPVCVLTGPHTYSAAVEFAEAVKTFGLATIVGEETGGQPNSFGNQFLFSLPRSRLSLQIATARGVRANGSLADFSPVKPDIVVRATAADMRRAFDPVLERAKTCPPRSIR